MKKFFKKLALTTMCFTLLTSNLSYATPIPTLISEEPVPTLYDNDTRLSFISQLSTLDIMKFSLYSYDGKANINTFFDTTSTIIKPQFIDNIYYVPLRVIAENLNYSLVWDNDTRSICLTNKDTSTTISLKINSSEYSKSSSSDSLNIKNTPIIKDNQTMIPLEFIGELFDTAFDIRNNELTLYESNAAKHSGYVKNIRATKNGYQVTIAKDLDATLEKCIILNISSDTVFNTNNNEINIGDYIYAVTSMATTMSIPAQTYTYVIH